MIERAAAAAQKLTQKKNFQGYALDEVNDLLGSSANFMWSIDPAEADQGTVGGEGDQDFQDRVSQMQNFPIFQDYMGGATQMFSQEYGVLLKLQQDIKNQIAKGVTDKAELPGISLDSVQPPDISKEQYAQEYKNLYNIPDFNPAKVSKSDIGGNIEQVQKASRGGIKFLKGKGKSYGYETYELLDTVNPELPNAGMSPSQYYIQMFNKVTGQNIGK